MLKTNVFFLLAATSYLLPVEVQDQWLRRVHRPYIFIVTVSVEVSSREMEKTIKQCAVKKVPSAPRSPLYQPHGHWVRPRRIAHEVQSITWAEIDYLISLYIVAKGVFSSSSSFLLFLFSLLFFWPLLGFLLLPVLALSF